MISLQPGFQSRSSPSSASCTHQTLLWDGARQALPPLLCHLQSSVPLVTASLVATARPGGQPGREGTQVWVRVAARCVHGEGTAAPGQLSVLCDLGGVEGGPWNLLGEAALEHLGCGQK